MNKSTDTPKPATTDQTLETLSSLAEIKTDEIVKIIPTAGLQFYLHASTVLNNQVYITDGSSTSSRPLWTIHYQKEENEFFHVRSYPDSHLYMTYIAREDKVSLRTYSGNDDQKWLFLIADGGGLYIQNITEDNYYLSVRLPLQHQSPIFTFRYNTVYAQSFTFLPV
ncbi:hypothetical protein [Pseudomonas asplenii]|uniref:hypothetical protein n=1 Tax=Pseudomonas asplenii TaxID=53407 RepID=UPI00037E2C8C|nr:hypothetical protein [Pseudomonas fuscovaginae]